MIRDANIHSMGAVRGRRPVHVLASLALVCILLLGFLAWRAPAQAQSTTITLSPDPATIEGCETIQVEIWVNDVVDLYGVDVQISFDPGLFQVVDALPGLTGVQVEPVTTWLDPGWAVRNSADNVAGTIWYAMTQLHPSLPKSGSGPVARIHLQAAGEGSASLHFYYTKLAERSGLQIPATAVDGSADAVPPAGPALTISRLNATDARLSWGAVPGVAAYHLYRDTSPYFTPAAPPLYSGAALQYDDVGALGDVNTNYYYLVRAACENGFESANSERMGEFDFALVPGAAGGVRKYNYITYVLEVPGVTNADSLADYVGVGTVYQVMRYDPVTQSFSFPGNVWMPQFGIGNNFPLVVGQVYALQLEQSAPSIVGLVGRVPDPGSVTFSLVAGASAGDRRYNFISVPLDRPDLLNADQLADDIHPSAVYQVMQYDAQLQSYPFPANVWMPRFNIGTNFPVRIGYPYVVQLEQGAPTTWPLYQETHPTMEEER